MRVSARRSRSTRTREDSAAKIAALAGLSDLGNKRETTYSVEREESELSDCFNGSPGCSGNTAVANISVARHVWCYPLDP
jgi:hypothetical protein